MQSSVKGVLPQALRRLPPSMLRGLHLFPLSLMTVFCYTPKESERDLDEVGSIRSTREEPTYDSIGSGYDHTRRADPYLVERLASLLCQRTDGHYLDLACGTGNYSAALAARGGHWVGVDHSSKMLREAARKCDSVSWHEADVEDLPFAAASFDGAILTLALHHFASPVHAFREVARVLKAAAPLVIFTSTAEQMRGYWLNHYFPQALERAIEQMPSLESTRSALRAAGLRIVASEPYHVRTDLEDLFLYSGKHRPELYLDARVRNGSSTFASLAAPEEVAEGCARLAADLASGRFAEVAAGYDDRDGDYLFLVATTGEEK